MSKRNTPEIWAEVLNDLYWFHLIVGCNYQFFSQLSVTKNLSGNEEFIPEPIFVHHEKYCNFPDCRKWYTKPFPARIKRLFVRRFKLHYLLWQQLVLEEINWHSSGFHIFIPVFLSLGLKFNYSLVVRFWDVCTVVTREGRLATFQGHQCLIESRFLNSLFWLVDLLLPWGNKLRVAIYRRSCISPCITNILAIPSGDDLFCF